MSDFPTVGESDWRDAVERELGAGVESLATEEFGGLIVAPLYTRTVADAAGFPGLPPYVRGSRALPQRPPWQRCQRVSDPDLRRAGQQIGADRAGGVDAVWLQLDRGTRTGLDVDAEDPLRACGHGGVIAVGAGDLAELIQAAGEGPLGIVLDAGGNALPAAAALFAALEGSAQSRGSLRLRLGCDPLGALVRDGELPTAPDALMAEMATFMQTLGADYQRCRAFTVSVLPHAAAGADAVQQLAVMIATMAQYLRWLDHAGMEPQVAVRLVDLQLPMERDFLLGIAKLRAARLLWGKLLAACELPPAAPWLHAVAGERTLTRADPWVNLLRVSTQVAAGGIGGADEITASAFDERVGRSDALGRRMARNTHAVLAEESGIGSVLDAAGGAHAVEALTVQMARLAWEVAQEFDRDGGIADLIMDGGLQDRIERTSHARAERSEQHVDAILGVSDYPPSAAEVALERDRVDVESAVSAARSRLGDLLARRADPLLEALRATAYEPEDIASVATAARDAALAGATIAEIGDAARPAAARRRARMLRPHSDEELWVAAHESAP